MPGVSSFGVSNFSNTTNGYAVNVVADGVVSGTGVVCLYSDVPPVVIDYLITQDNQILNTQSDEKIYVDVIMVASTLTTQGGDVLEAQDNRNIIT